MKVPNLAYYRNLAGLTQEELAEKVGINRVTLSYLEHGEHQPRLRTLKKLADMLGVSTKDLGGERSLKPRHPQ